MLAVRKNIFQADSLEKTWALRGIWQNVISKYWGILSMMTSDLTRRSKRPPRDAFNSMLSFGYTLLMYEIYTAEFAKTGLHPYFGFLHSLHNGHPALASDLMEEWRAVLIDSLVLSLVEHHEVKISDFLNYDEEQGIYMSRR